MLHLIVRQVAKASQDHYQVGGVKRLQAGDIIQLLRVDCAILLVDGEQDRAAEAVVSRQNFRQLRQRFLGTVLFVSTDENDILSLRLPVGLKHQEWVSRPAGGD